MLENMPIQAHSVACQSCASPLEISADIRFLTCNYCNSHLEIVRDTGTTHSIVLQRIESKVDNAAGRLRVMELKLKLNELNQAWQKYQEATLPRRENGTRKRLTSDGEVGFPLVVSFLGFFMIFHGLTTLDGNGGEPLIGAFLFVAMGYRAICNVGKLREFQKAEAEFVAGRSALQKQLQEAETNVAA